MSLKYAMLGFLDMSPFSGYDIKKMFDTSVKFYWTATHSQIYRTLNEMYKEELVDVEEVYQTESPNKKIYHITEKGREELTEWVATPADIAPIRNKLLVQLSWSDRLETENIISVLNDYSDKLKIRLNMYRSKEHMEIIKMGRTKREQFLWKATLENGIMTYEAELKWIDKTVLGLKSLENE